MKALKERVLGKFAMVGAVSALAMLSAGWTNKLPTPMADHNANTLQSDAAFMRAVFAAKARPGEDTIAIDLADGRQYSFVVNRLVAAGKTPGNSPYLYERVRQMREKALQRQGSGGVSTQDTSAGGWCSHYLYVGNEVVVGGKITYTATPVVACNGGANYVYADILTYDSNQAGTDNIPAGSAAGEDYSGGTNFVGDLIINPAVSIGRVLRADSMMMAMDDGTGQEQITFSDAQTAATPQRQGISLTHPRELVGGAGSAIKVCQQRGGSECDYAVAGYVNSVLRAYPTNPTGVAGAVEGSTTGQLDTTSYWAMGAPYNYSRIYLPVRGVYDAGARTADCRITRFESAKLRLHLVNPGRQCYVETDFLGALATGARTSNFNFLADFSRTTGGAAGCNMESIVNEPVTLWMQIKGWADCGQGMEEQRFTSTTHDNRPLVDRQIFYHNSCMAAGTQVLRADGTLVSVEKIQRGDKIVANGKAVALTVTDIVHGGENKPLVQLRDDAGHSVRLTEQHPVITASGDVVAAVSLKVQDRVLTRSGVTTLTEVKRIPYDGKVYNLVLGTPEELLKVGKNETTLFADGFLVGDGAMQLELETPKYKKADVLATLPKAWHKDYLNRPGVKGSPTK